MASSTAVVKIADRPVGPGERVFIVAEAGVNHNGRVGTALALVDAAVRAGADAVKFQMFRAADLVTRRAATVRYQRERCKVRSQFDMLSRLELSLDQLATIRQYCDQRGILFMATPFAPAEAARLVGLDAAAVKIASTDLTNRPLLQAACAGGLPIICSTGASRVEEIERSVGWLRDWGVLDRLILLHCVSRYPAPVEAINLGAIQTLANTYHRPCGLSDHTVSTSVGGWAVAGGACLLEKHLTLDTRQAGPDHAMSLTPDRLAAYVATARAARAAMGAGRPGMAREEAEVRAAARRSVVSAVDIPRGTILSSKHLTMKRPGTGLTGDAFVTLLGRRAAVDIQSDTLLAWDMVR